jgi:uncharacterized protein YqjF (DUF2071 family)
VELISPYPPHPIARPIMVQTWRSLTFLHWAYEPAVIGRLLPAGLELDTFDGAAWVGLAPFVLVNLRPPMLPAFPWVSQFPETNVRTYVRGPDGKRGVWFFTLEADRLLAVLGARAFYHLPYRWARMRVQENGGTVKYESERSWPFGAGHSSVSVRPGDRMEVGQLDNFLTARYRLYSVTGTRIGHAEIEHEPWPLQRAEVVELQEDLIERSGVPKPVGKPVVHFSRSLDVRVGWPTMSQTQLHRKSAYT